jgi:hypothetical protein
MEKFSQFRDKGKSPYWASGECRIDLVHQRLRHCAIPPCTDRVEWHCPAVSCLPVHMSRALTALLQHCILRLLPVPTIRRFGQESLAVVHLRNTRNMVDRSAN